MHIVSKLGYPSRGVDDPKDPFSIVTKTRCRGGRYSFPWMIPLNP